MSDDGSSDEESSDLDEIMDFDDLDFFDQELMDKYCSESASLKKEELAQSLKGAKDLFIQDGGCVLVHACACLRFVFVGWLRAASAALLRPQLRAHSVPCVGGFHQIQCSFDSSATLSSLGCSVL